MGAILELVNMMSTPLGMVVAAGGRHQRILFHALGPKGLASHAQLYSERKHTQKCIIGEQTACRSVSKKGGARRALLPSHRSKSVAALQSRNAD